MSRTTKSETYRGMINDIEAKLEAKRARQRQASKLFRERRKIRIAKLMAEIDLLSQTSQEKKNNENTDVKKTIEKNNTKEMYWQIEKELMKKNHDKEILELNSKIEELERRNEQLSEANNQLLDEIDRLKFHNSYLDEQIHDALLKPDILLF